MSGNSIGRMVPEGWMTRTQAAAAVGRSVSTIRRWESDAERPVRPSGSMRVGRLDVGLYSAADIAVLMDRKRTTRTGPKPKHSNDEGENDA